MFTTNSAITCYLIKTYDCHVKSEDMPDDIKAAVPAYIKSHVDRNICKINF